MAYSRFSRDRQIVGAAYKNLVGEALDFCDIYRRTNSTRVPQWRFTYTTHGIRQGTSGIWVWLGLALWSGRVGSTGLKASWEKIAARENQL